MKVCTDACLFGAVVANKIYREQNNVTNLLDIGAGTGLLSLQVAQKTNAAIDAVEIDEAAFEQAGQNFDNAPWSERLTILNIDVLNYISEKKYDCIISNPPFFEGDLKSDNRKKNAAKHDTALTLEQLLGVIDQHLDPKGYFAILLPYQRVEYFITIAAAAKYSLQEQLLIRHTESHQFFRGILFFSLAATKTITNRISIKDTMGNYSPEFKHLLKDYYLQF
jgi:tRNA1Val (adenine37-N6)-methyltransferase